MRWEELPLMLAGRPEGVVWIRWQPCFRRSFHSYSTLQEEAQQCGQPHKLPHQGVVISVISMHNWLLGYSAGASPTLVQNSVASTMKLISLLCIILSKAAFDGIHEKQTFISIQSGKFKLRTTSITLATITHVAKEEKVWTLSGSNLIMEFLPATVLLSRHPFPVQIRH